MQGLQVQYLVRRTKILHVTAKKKKNRDKELKTYLFSSWMFWLRRMNFRMSKSKHGMNRVATGINFHLLFKDVFLFKYIVIWYKIISPYLKKKIPTTVVVIQSLSHVWLFEIPWTAAHQAPLSFTISQSLLEFMSTGLMMLSNHLIRCCPPSPFAFNLSHHQGLFQWVASVHQMAKWMERQHQSFQWIFRVDFL